MDLIIGAGITGLTYANFTKNPYLILEADDHIGGLCNTIVKDGFIWDYSGHFFHFQHPKIASFVQERVSKDELVTVQKYTQIKYKDRLVDFPFQKNIHQLEYSEFIDCLCDLFEENNIPITSFKSMLYAKFGKSIADKFLIPYNEKLYATDLNRLDKDAMGRFFPYANKEDIIRNFRANTNDSYNGSFIYPKHGAIQYVDAVARDLNKENICLSEEVISIDLQRHELRTTNRTLKYDNLISTIPLVKLIRLANIPYQKELFTWNKVLVFNLGFDIASDDKANHWIYFPEKTYCFYRVGFYSNIIPSDRMSLYVEIGFSNDDDVDVNSMLQQTLTDLQKAEIISNQRLVSWHSVIMNPAYVHITEEGLEETQRIKKLLAVNNVYSIGRYGSWNYSSIEDNMIEATELAISL